MTSVCHMTSAHFPHDTRIFYKECTSIASMGYDTYLVECGESFTENGVSVVGYGERPKSRIKRFLHASNLTYQIAKGIDADIYHFHDPELLPYGLKLKRSGKVVIFDSHENYPAQIGEKEYLPKLVRLLISRFYKMYETYVCKRLDAVVVSSTCEGVDIFKGRSKKSIVVDNYPIINNGVDVPEFTREIRDSVCYAGTLGSARGITQLVKACHKAEVRLILCGSISDDYRMFLERLPEYECVDYRGKLDKAGVADVMSRSFCGSAALLNIGQYWKDDNLPTKVYEYYLAGIPCILSPSPYNIKFVEKYGCAIIVDPENIDEYASAILHLKSSVSESERLARNGYRAVLDQFNWAKEEVKIKRLYEEA